MLFLIEGVVGVVTCGGADVVSNIYKYMFTNNHRAGITYVYIGIMFWYFHV